MVQLGDIAITTTDEVVDVEHFLGKRRLLGVVETWDASQGRSLHELVATACSVALTVREDCRHLVADPTAEVALDFGLGYSVVALAALDHALYPFSGRLFHCGSLCVRTGSTASPGHRPRRLQGEPWSARLGPCGLQPVGGARTSPKNQARQRRERTANSGYLSTPLPGLPGHHPYIRLYRRRLVHPTAAMNPA